MFQSQQMSSCEAVFADWPVLALARIEPAIFPKVASPYLRPDEHKVFDIALSKVSKIDLAYWRIHMMYRIAVALCDGSECLFASLRDYAITLEPCVLFGRFLVRKAAYIILLNEILADGFGNGMCHHHGPDEESISVEIEALCACFGEIVMGNGQRVVYIKNPLNALIYRATEPFLEAGAFDLPSRFISILHNKTFRVCINGSLATNAFQASFTSFGRYGAYPSDLQKARVDQKTGHQKTGQDRF